jgi:hypothetical protein
MSTPTAKPTRQQLDELDALLQRMLSLPINQLDAELPPPPALPEMTSSPPMPAPPMAPAYAAPRTFAPPPAAPVPAAQPRRRAEPPTGNNLWNIPLPPSVGAAPSSNWPAGIEALTASATSTVAPQPAPQPGKLRVTTIPSPDEANRSREAPPTIQRGPYAQAPIAGPAPAPPVPMSLPMPAPLPPMFPPASLPFYLWPLGALDHSIANLLSAFGPPGRWIGQGGGKTLVGWCGMLMLAGAAAWGVMDYLGVSW